MHRLRIKCFFCKRSFIREVCRINENKKLGHNHYCSIACLGESRKNRKSFICENPKCKEKFDRSIGSISVHNYCSQSCATIVNNTKYPKNPGVRKKCLKCGKDFVSLEKYCSLPCVHKSQIIGKRKILGLIKNFHKRYGRIPLKREVPHYYAARSRFGTWNNAIKSAGFDTNPVMFANTHTANDGHKCDSLSEKIIDDWLFAKKIEHKINVPYPGSSGYTVDFLIKDWWIEFFGLSGGCRKYDKIVNKKFDLVKIHKLKFIEIYPRHLFPKNNLAVVLSNMIIR